MFEFFAVLEVLTWQILLSYLFVLFPCILKTLVLAYY